MAASYSTPAPPALAKRASTGSLYDTNVTGGAAESSTATRPDPERTESKAWATARRFFSASAQTWVGMTPLWLLGEAIIPGQKVGGQFKKGARKLQSAALEVQEAVQTNAKDIVIILDDRFQSSKAGGDAELTRATEVIKAAGSNALLVVTASIERAQQELEAHKELSPEIKKAIASNSRDVVVLLDKALKNPVVITGVKKFAESKNIPHADALLRLASMGLTKILAAMPEEPKDEKAGKGVKNTTKARVEQLDAADLEKQTSKEGRESAEKVGKNGQGPAPKVEEGPADPYEKMKKANDCVVM